MSEFHPKSGNLSPIRHHFDKISRYCRNSHESSFLLVPSLTSHRICSTRYSWAQTNEYGQTAVNIRQVDLS